MNMNPSLAIKIVSGSSAGRAFAIKESLFIGSGFQCEIQITDPSVSALHARVDLRGNAYNLVDLVDVPSVKVNGRLVKSRKLALHDKITIGDVAMEVVELSEVAVPPPPPSPPSPEPEIVVVGTEPASRAAEMEELAADTWVEPVEEEEARHCSERASTRRPQYYRPEVAIQEKRSAENRTSRYIMISVMVIIVLLVVGLAWTVKRAGERQLERSYREAVDFAQAHPDDPELVMEKYRQAQQDCAARPQLESFFAVELAKIETQRVIKAREFEVLLQSLDKKANELVVAQSFEEALKVYDVSNAKMKARIAAIRADVIDNLKQKAARMAAQQKGQQQKKEADQKILDEFQAKEDLKKATAGVVAAAIDGRCNEAVTLLEQLGTDAKFASQKDKIGEAVSTVKLLLSTDAALKAGKPDVAGPVIPGEGDAAMIEALPPIVQAVYGVRAGNQIAALAQLKKAEGHFLCDGLAARIQVSEEQAKAENEALQKMTGAWAKLVNDTAAKLPKPADGVALVTKLAKEGSREQVAKAGADMAAVRTDYGKTKIVLEYEALFKALSEVAGGRPATPAAPTKLSGLGDGRIIQIEGDTYYAEANSDLTEAKDYSMGLCKEDTVYYAPDNNKVVGAWVDVYSVLPFRALSERQVMFSLMAGQKKQTPLVGDCVVIGKDLQTGKRFVAGSARTDPVAVFSSDFGTKLGQEWKSPSPTLAIEGGKLALDISANEQKPKSGEADLELNVELGTGPIGLEFDIRRKADAALRVGMGELEFLMGDHEGRKSGIYVSGKLVKPAEFPRPVLGVPQRVSITKGRAFVRIAVNKADVQCRVSPHAGESDVKKIVFFNSSKILLDNVVARKLAGTGEAGVVGVNAERKQVIVAKGYEADWQSVAAGHSVFFFNSRGDTNVVAEAKVQDIVDPWLVCAVTKGLTPGGGQLVALVPEYPQTPTVDQAVAEVAKPRKQASDILYALPKAAPAPAGVVALEMLGVVPEKGYLHPVLERFANPETGELLAVMPGEPARCDFKQEGSTVTCSVGEGAALPTISNEGVLISKILLPLNRRIDIPAYSFAFMAGAPGARKELWKVTNGEWKEKLGRAFSSPAPGVEGPAVITLNEVMGDGVQCDVDVRLEKEGKQAEDEWVKDLMVELYFPARQIGVMVGVGGEKDGGITVLGHTITQEKGKQALNWMARPDVIKVRVEGAWEKNAPTLKVGQNYRLRIRRAKDVLTFYINGKRLVYIQHPQLDGDMQLRIAAAEAPLSIGKVTGFELPRNYKTPDEEPALGEFGYVVWAEGQQVLADADMDGVVPNRKVSIMTIDKVVKGEKSKTVFLKRVATGTVAEVGPRTVKILCVDEGTPITKGMKILPGALPASVTFTDTRLQDLDQGL